ncbi:MAG: carbonic anhydrase [Pseudomonadota bacterium]
MPKTARLLPAYLMTRMKGWRATEFTENKAWYAALAEHGQHPRAMVISCCDSRVEPQRIFGADAGEFFIVRNVANLVPPFTPNDDHHGTSAAIEYAVKHLGVAHIVVIGHSSCGGVAACHAMCSGHAPEFEEKDSFIGRWIDILRPGFQAIKERNLPEEEELTAMEQQGVRVSLQNLTTYPFVADALEAGRLTIHGVWFEIGTGRMMAFDGEAQAFQPI